LTPLPLSFECSDSHGLKLRSTFDPLLFIHRATKSRFHPHPDRKQTSAV
jgi:hypothetical protein